MIRNLLHCLSSDAQEIYICIHTQGQKTCALYVLKLSINLTNMWQGDLGVSKSLGAVDGHRDEKVYVVLTVQCRK